ncbi:MAG: AI-2E family transporter [Clostridia bacterium]|nr:AI-2E family transporter [Clostridia bacterium]
MKNNKNIAQWVTLFLLGLALIVVYKAFDSLGWIWAVFLRLFSILTPFVIGFVIAFLLFAPVNRLDGFFRKRKSKFFQKTARPLSVLIVYILALGVVAGLVYIVMPALVSALKDFVANVPTYYANVMSFLQQYTQPGGLLENFDIQGKINETYALIQQYLTVERILSYMSSISQVTSSVVDGLMAIIVSVYMLLGRESLVSASKSVLGLICKPRTMQSLSLYGHKTARIFYNYIYSQLLDALVVGVLATIGFLLARMPNAPVFGMLLGIMNMVPYFGALIGGVLSVLIMLLSGNLYGALFIAIYILVMQQIDANIIQPRIIGDNVGIRPIYVLLGITVFGGLFGFWGIFLGAPCMAVIQLLLTDYIRYRNAVTVTGHGPSDK